MLAHLLGDGCVAPRQPIHYTSADPACLDAVEQAAVHFGITPRRVAAGHLFTRRTYPRPQQLARGRRNPIAAWLDQWGLYGKRSHEKFVPDPVFALERRPGRSLPRPSVGDRRMRRLVGPGSRLLRVDEPSAGRRCAAAAAAPRHTFHPANGRRGHRVAPATSSASTGATDQIAFLDRDRGGRPTSGRSGRPAGAARGGRAQHERRHGARRGVDPGAEGALSSSGITTRSLPGRARHHLLRFDACTGMHPSRDRLAAVVADIVDDDRLRSLATSDVFWDRVVAIEPVARSRSTTPRSSRRTTSSPMASSSRTASNRTQTS